MIQFQENAWTEGRMEGLTDPIQKTPNLLHQTVDYSTHPFN